MHGLRAMHDVQHHYFVTDRPDRKQVELYIEASYRDKNLSFALKRIGQQGDTHMYRLKIAEYAYPTQKLAFRQPGWADSMHVVYQNTPVLAAEDGYIVLNQPLSAGDSIDINITYRKVILNSQREPTLLSDLDQQSTKGTLQYGPYLMGVDGYSDPTFTAEPASNVIFIGSLRSVSGDSVWTSPTVAMAAQYQHGGYPSQLSTYLVPVAGQTFRRHGPFSMEMDFTRGAPQQDRHEMLNPWQPTN